MSSECPGSPYRCHPAVTALAVAGVGALVWKPARLAHELFGSAIPYRLVNPITDPLDSEVFVQFLSIITDALISRDTTVEVLKNGVQVYPAELEAIRAAQRTVQL